MKNRLCAALGGLVVAGAIALAQGGQAPQSRPAQPTGGSPGGGARGAVGSAIFTAADADKDGAVTRAELKAAFDRWFTEWGGGGTLTQDQLVTGLSSVVPVPSFGGGTRAPQNQVPDPKDVQAMMAALPEKAPVKPKQPRKVLVLAKAAGFVHASIPLAARTIEEMGKKTGAWSTTITYDPADINEANLEQYDAIFLASTTGAFLDDPDDAAATAARRKALLDFVRSGKGLAGIHAATDSYHQSAPAPAKAQERPGGESWRAMLRGPVTPVAAALVSQGDRNGDNQLSRDEMAALADSWFDKLDPPKAGRVGQPDFPVRFAAVLPPPPPPALGPTGFPIQPPATQLGPDREVGTWPEFNKLLGGFFKFHWNDGQVIQVKVDEPDHPINAPFKGRPQLQVMDEIYTFGRETYSRENVRVLTSVDYEKMSAEDKAKEQYPRPDGDYALSWVRREGEGRVFYEALGHSERVYAMTPVLEHVLYGMQYVLGDLEAADSPGRKPGSSQE